MNARDNIVSNALNNALDSIIQEVVTVFKDVAASDETESILEILKTATTPKFETAEELVRGVTQYLTHKIADKDHQINSLKVKLKWKEQEVAELIEASYNLQETADSCERSNALLAKETINLKIRHKEGQQQFIAINDHKDYLNTKIKVLEQKITKLSAENRDQTDQIQIFRKIINKQKKLNQPINPDLFARNINIQMSTEVVNKIEALIVDAASVLTSYRSLNINRRNKKVLATKKHTLNKVTDQYNELKLSSTEENIKLLKKLKGEIRKSKEYLELKLQDLSPVHTSDSETELVHLNSTSEEEESDNSEPQFGNNLSTPQNQNQNKTPIVNSGESKTKETSSTFASSQTPNKETKRNNNLNTSTIKLNDIKPHNVPEQQHIIQNPIQFQPENIQLENMALNRFDIINRRVIANVQMFEGGSGPHVEDQLDAFLTNCDYVLQSLNGDEEIQYFMGGLKTRFAKDAYQLINNANMQTYGELKILLKDTYKPEKTMAELNHAFYNCRQKPDEKTSNYFRRLQTILNEAKKIIRIRFPQHTEGLIQNQEIEAMNVFKRGTINPGLGQHLLLSPATTMAELELAAKTYEDAEKQVASGFFHMGSNAQALTVNQYNNNNNYGYTNRTAGHNNMQHNHPGQNYNSNGNYQRQGYHYPSYPVQQQYNQQRDPRRNGNYSQNQNRSIPIGNNRNSSNNQPSCYLCGNTGHFQSNCALANKMCSRCKAWDHTLNFCPQNFNNNNGSITRPNELLEQPRIYCDNCGACGHEIQNCTLPQKPSTSTGIRDSGNERVQVKDARTPAP